MLLNRDLFVALIETTVTPFGSRHNANGEMPIIKSNISNQYNGVWSIYIDTLNKSIETLLKLGVWLFAIARDHYINKKYTWSCSKLCHTFFKCLYTIANTYNTNISVDILTSSPRLIIIGTISSGRLR